MLLWLLNTNVFNLKPCISFDLNPDTATDKHPLLIIAALSHSFARIIRSFWFSVLHMIVLGWIVSYHSNFWWFRRRRRHCISLYHFSLLISLAIILSQPALCTYSVYSLYFLVERKPSRHFLIISWAIVKPYPPTRRRIFKLAFNWPNIDAICATVHSVFLTQMNISPDIDDKITKRCYIFGSITSPQATERKWEWEREKKQHPQIWAL